MFFSKEKHCFLSDGRLLKNFQRFFTSSILLLRNYNCFVTARFHFGQICCARHTLHVASKLEGNRRPKQAKSAHGKMYFHATWEKCHSWRGGVRSWSNTAKTLEQLKPESKTRLKGYVARWSDCRRNATDAAKTNPPVQILTSRFCSFPSPLIQCWGAFRDNAWKCSSRIPAQHWRRGEGEITKREINICTGL